MPPSDTQPRSDGPRKVIEIISDSDVLLKVGEGKDALDIKVSSVILKASSKVFKRMLESQYIEATSKVIDLKEDDPQAVLDFCRIVHHRADSVWVSDAKQLRALIILSDMRDCGEALKPWMLGVLGGFLKWVDDTFQNPTNKTPMVESVPGWTITDGITFAVAFEMSELFLKITRAYLAAGVWSYLSPGLDNGANLRSWSEALLPGTHSSNGSLYGLSPMAPIHR